MTILNQTVEHIMFGIGTVMDVKDNRIWVRFQEEIGTKMFLYPEAFEKFLKAMNPSVESSALEELRIKREQIELERKEKERQAAELEEELTKLLVAKKKSTSRKRKL